MSQRGLSRRSFLGHLGVAGLGVAGLSACSVSTDTGGNKGKDNTPEFNFKDIPDSGAKIPTEDVTVGWMDSGDLKALFQEPMFEGYMKKYPNITIDYQPTPWDRINEAIPVAVRNNSAPDVFAIPNNVPSQVAVNEGWVKPIDDLVPNFDDWKETLGGDAIFIEGIHVFDGKTYTFPATSDRRYGYMLFFHPAYVEQAEIDPINERLTWTSFRDACKRITKNGKGKYYGLSTAADQLAPMAVEFAKLAGLQIVGQGGNNVMQMIDPQTGEIPIDAPEMVEAVELLLAIRDDKSMFPGFMGTDHATARARWPQGVAAFIVDGPWDLPVWPRDYPDFEFDIAYPPTGDDGQEYPAPYFQTGANFLWVSAGTDNDAVIGDIFSYYGSVEAQANVGVFSEGNLTSVIPEADKLALESGELNENAVKGLDIAKNLMKVAPDPRVRNPDVSKAILEIKPVATDTKTVIQQVFAGDTDLASALKQHKQEVEKAFEDGIAAAVKKGAQVSRDDFVFADWDRTKDFTPEMYDEL